MSEKKEENDLEKLTRLAEKVAKPWCIITWILAILLAFSLYGNIYGGPTITFGADDNVESNIEQTNNG